MFIGIEGIARKVTGAHIGVDGVARKVKKAYVGVDGVARLAWEAGETGSADVSRWYNLLDMSGWYYDYREPHIGGTSTEVEFGVGNCPLMFDSEQYNLRDSTSEIGVNTGSSMRLYPPVTIETDSYIEVEYYFPTVTFDHEYGYIRQAVGLSKEGVLLSSVQFTYNQNNDNAITLYDSGVLGSIVYSEIYGENGGIIGVRFSGVAKRPFDAFTVVDYADEVTVATPFTSHCTVTRTSYNDLRFRVKKPQAAT